MQNEWRTRTTKRKRKLRGDVGNERRLTVARTPLSGGRRCGRRHWPVTSIDPQSILPSIKSNQIKSNQIKSNQIQFNSMQFNQISLISRPEGEQQPSNQHSHFIDSFFTSNSMNLNQFNQSNSY